MKVVSHVKTGYLASVRKSRLLRSMESKKLLTGTHGVDGVRCAASRSGNNTIGI